MSYVTGYVDCHCGRKDVLRTSWTEDNPGRRFLSCLEYDRGGCRFFSWEDPPICRRARAIIPGLLKRINNMNEELVKLKFENKELGKLKFENTELVKLKCQNKRLRRLVIILAVLLVITCWSMSSFKGDGVNKGQCFQMLA